MTGETGARDAWTGSMWTSSSCCHREHGGAGLLASETGGACAGRKRRRPSSSLPRKHAYGVPAKPRPPLHRIERERRKNAQITRTVAAVCWRAVLVGWRRDGVVGATKQAGIPTSPPCDRCESWNKCKCTVRLKTLLRTESLRSRLFTSFLGLTHRCTRTCDVRSPFWSFYIYILIILMRATQWWNSFCLLSNLTKPVWPVLHSRANFGRHHR